MENSGTLTAWQQFLSVTAPAVTAPAPTLTVSNDPTASPGQTVALSSLVTIADPDSVGYQNLELWDANGTVTGGEFVVNGMPQTGGQEIDVAPANVAGTVFDVGTLGGTDTLWARLLENDGTLTAWQQFSVTAPALTAPAPTVTTPTISGTAQEGATLTASASAGQTDNAVTYQWFNSADGFTNAIGSGAVYQVQEGDEGNQIEVVATATNDKGLTVAATSSATGTVVDAPPALNVSISGTAQEGQTLTAIGTADDSDAVINYQWQQLIGGTWTNIAGQTGSTYAITEANEGSRLRVVATSSDSDGSGTSATSAATASVVDPPPALTIPSPTLFVAAGGSVSLPLSVAGFDSDDKVSVNIAGLPTFEAITDNLNKKVFSGASVTLTAAEVNSGLTLHSSYGGTGQPVDVLTVTATNTTAGEGATSAAQTITVTDPVPSTLASAPGTLDQRVALLAQYMASTFATSGAGDAAILAVDQMAATPQQVSLVQPQH